MLWGTCEMGEINYYLQGQFSNKANIGLLRKAIT